MTKPADLTGIFAPKGKATSGNSYIGDETPSKPTAKQSPKASNQAKKIDGRTLRKTGRTLKFAATVKPEWANELKAIAAAEGRLIVEILEDALSQYKGNR